MSDPDASSASPMVLVFSTGSIPEGLLVKGLLESAQIPVAMKGESEGPYRMGPVYLWVPKDLEDRARLVIEDARSRDGSEGSGSQGEGS